MAIGRTLAAAALAAGVLWGSAARASGDEISTPWYVDRYGGDPADAHARYAGRMGIVMPTAPRPILFIDWRLLHGQSVGAAAGDALATPCCDKPWWREDRNTGPGGWGQARKLVPGIGDGFVFIDVERQGPDYTFTKVCFDEAFDTATATLRARIAAHGAYSPGVKAWLATQDAVFANCHTSTPVPPAPAGAPAWLLADHAYQEAAAAYYDGRWADAARGFTAIAADGGSAWRGTGVYLTARALTHGAVAEKTPAVYAAANAALARLAKAPDGTFGKSQLEALRSFLAIHEDPAGVAVQLERRLAAPTPEPKIAEDFRDLSELADQHTASWDALDWMATMKAEPPPVDRDKFPDPGAAPSDEERQAQARRTSLGHAVDRWRASGDPAWLIAALSLADPGDAQGAALIADARAVPEANPAWLTVQYHLARLTLAQAAPTSMRRSLDDILARTTLFASDRNVFQSLRTQAAADLPDFVGHALRRRLCGPVDMPPQGDLTDVQWETQRQAKACVRARWPLGGFEASGIYDGFGGDGSTGFGEDARAIIDRMPLRDRMALAADVRLPTRLRLDVALTSYARAVQLQDDRAIDSLAADLVSLLPLMAQDFRAVGAARPGPGKRFAEFLVLAQIPGVRVDLAGYTRPEGATLAAFQGYWIDWQIARVPGAAAPPPLGHYADTLWGAPDDRADLSCLGECGRGAAPLRLPGFVDTRKAAAERGFFVSTEHRFGEAPPAPPPGSIDAWEEMLTYVAAHPADPRAPEALYWLVHVGHLGGSHDHSGRRAFRLLHARYGASTWARKTPYYYD